MRSIRSISCLLLIGATFSFITSAKAHPGDSISQLQQKLSASPIFQGANLSYDSLYGGGYQTAYVSYAGGNIYFFADDQSNIVVSEGIQLRGTRSSYTFEREHQSSLDIIRQVWGEGTLNDFVNSKFTDSITSGGFSEPNRFYLGDRFGYWAMIIPVDRYSEGIYTFRVLEKGEWEEARNNVRFCSQNPNHENCVGL